MGPQNMPAAEVDVTADLIESLLAEQHPDLAGLAVVELANGWDNVMFRLGDNLTVRAPRREMAARLIDHEQAVLPGFAERLPIAISAPVRAGRPSDVLGYPWSWSIGPWLPGGIVADATLVDSRLEAQRLGGFLAALHVVAPPDAPPNPYRGHFIGANTPIFTERAEQLRSDTILDVDVDVLLTRWSQLVDVGPWPHEPVWLHGDLHAANMLASDGAISGVIDFGDVCAGDPATDLSVAWSLFDAADREAFRDAASAAPMGIDDATWQRAEAWALHFVVMYLLHSADNATMGGIGHRLLAALIG